MANEKNTENLFEKLLKDNGFRYSLIGSHKSSDNCICEGQKSSTSTKINALLKNASKKGNSKGYPDYIRG